MGVLLFTAFLGIYLYRDHIDSLKKKYPSLKEMMAAEQSKKDALKHSQSLDKKKELFNTLKKL